MALQEIAVIGPGRVGLALAHRLVGEGLRCPWVMGRGSLPPGAEVPPGTVARRWGDGRRGPWPELVLVCVGDRHLEGVAATIVDAVDVRGCTFLHTSGLHTAGVLGGLAEAGAAVASWHPLQTFPGTLEVVLDGIPCAVEGDPAAVATGFELASRLGLVPWPIDPADKVRYHAAAAVAANLSHILVTAGRDLLASCHGLPVAAGEALAPLVRSSLEAALRSRGLEALTGPLARRDLVTVQRHLEVLPEPLARAYSALATVFAELHPEGPELH